MPIKINGGGNSQFYGPPKRVCATKNNDFPMEDRYIGLICQHSLEDILNVSQMFIKLLHQPTKPPGIVGNFPNRQKWNKEAYDSVDDFLHQLKEDIGEPIATIYFKDITGTTTIDDNEEKLFFPHNT